MKTILLSNYYDDVPLQILNKVIPEGFKLVTLNSVSQEELLEKAHIADYLLVSGRLQIDEKVINNASKLRMVQRTGVGLDVLDLTKLKEHNIPLYVNYGVNSNSVAEYTLLLILSCLRNVCEVNRQTKTGIWSKQKTGIVTKELYKKKIGIIGMGKIGQRLVELLKAFNVQIVYYDKIRLDVEMEEKLGIEYVSLEHLFSSVDIVSLNCALTRETEHIINSTSLNLMKKGVVIINTARGKLICEKDLEAALECGIVSCAALDVFEEEPIVAEHTLFQRENVICTSHIGGITYESFYNMMKDAVSNIDNFEKGNYKAIEEFKHIII